MAPFLVILGLLLLGVAIVAWHTRAIWWHAVAPYLPQPPLTRAAKAAQTPAMAPDFPAAPEAFAEAPVSRSAVMTAPAAAPFAANESDPFAHAPAPESLQSGETRH